MTTKVPLKTTVGYAIGDFGINLYFIATMTWLSMFYTDVMGLSAIAAGSVVGVARLIDAITDPMIGALTWLMGQTSSAFAERWALSIKSECNDHS